MNTNIIKKLSLIINKLQTESLDDISSIAYSMKMNQDDSIDFDDLDSISLRYLLSYDFPEKIEVSNINLMSEHELINMIRELIKLMHKNNYFLEGVQKVAHESPEEDIVVFAKKFMTITCIDSIINDESNNWNLSDVICNLDDYTICEMLYIQYKIDYPEISIREYEDFDPYHTSLVDNVIATYQNPPKDITSIVKTNNKKLIRTLRTNLNYKELNDDEIAHLALCNSILSILN